MPDGDNYWRVTVGPPRHNWLQVRVVGCGDLKGQTKFWLLYRYGRFSATNHLRSLRAKHPHLEATLLSALERLGPPEHVGDIGRWRVTRRADLLGWDVYTLTAGDSITLECNGQALRNTPVLRQLIAGKPRLWADVQAFLQKTLAT